jgi:hypothetical protein
MFDKMKRHAGRVLAAIVFFVLTAGLNAQTDTNTISTNQAPTQPVSTNAVPAPISQSYTPPPGFIDQVPEANYVTNQPGMSALQGPATGPINPGAPSPQAPIMGISSLSGPPTILAPIVLGPGIPLWGPFALHPHLEYTFEYGNGIQAQPGVNSKTVIDTVAPGFQLDMGSHWSVDYTPSLSYYSNPAFKNTLDENVLLRGNWSKDNWGLGLTQAYLQTTQPLIETGQQTSEAAYTTAISATNQFSSKMSDQVDVNQNFRDAGGFSSLKEWTADDWVNYQAGSKWGLGIGLIGGYDHESSGPDMPFEQIQGRFNFHPGPKLTVFVSAGGEDRQFINPSEKPLINPVFSGVIMYSNNPYTVSLSASRQVTPSLFANEVEVISSYNATFRDQLTEKLAIEADVGYTTIPFTSIVPQPLPQFFIGAPPAAALAEVRNNDISTFKVSLADSIWRKATLSLFYIYRDISSSQANFSYTSHQVGFTFDYHY